MLQGKRKFSAVEAPRVNIKHPKRIQATPFSRLVKQGTGKFHHYTPAAGVSFTPRIRVTSQPSPKPFSIPTPISPLPFPLDSEHERLFSLLFSQIFNFLYQYGDGVECRHPRDYRT